MIATDQAAALALLRICPGVQGDALAQGAIVALDATIRQVEHLERQQPPARVPPLGRRPSHLRLVWPETQ